MAMAEIGSFRSRRGYPCGSHSVIARLFRGPWRPGFGHEKHWKRECEAETKTIEINEAQGNRNRQVSETCSRVPDGRLKDARKVPWPSNKRQSPRAPVCVRTCGAGCYCLTINWQYIGYGATTKLIALLYMCLWVVASAPP